MASRRSSLSQSFLVAGAVLAIGTAGATAASTPYARQPTVACLERHGGVVSHVRATNRRVRALRDLAQKTSFQVRLGNAVVAIAITRSQSDASFLFELLQVPKDPLVLGRQRNAVLLSPHRPASARRIVLGCLRA
jgi:hypothetical protein